MRLGKLYIILAVAALALSACNSSGCLENRSSLLYAVFYSMESGEKISVDSLEIIGEGMDDKDPLSAAGSPIGQILLPMRSTKDVTTWVFKYRQHQIDMPELYDTISFRYDSTPYFASSDCGVVYNYHINKVTYTKHLIDSVSVLDSLVTNVDKERLRVYFRTRSAANQAPAGIHTR